MTTDVSDASLPTIPGFEILAKIGEGGMGVVYKARHSVLKRVVAIKTVNAKDEPSRKHLIQRLQKEAEGQAKLAEHPNLVTVHDYIDDPPALVMAYVQGQNLAKVLETTECSPLDAARLVRTLALALQAVHDQRIIHRDLKPENVLLEGEIGRPLKELTPKVADFGLVKVLDDKELFTTTRQVLGTPCYMSPEQVSGRLGKVGPSTDIYGLGGILYYCLTRRPPFSNAETPLATMMQVIQDLPVAPRVLNPRVPKALEVICLKCLEKRSGRRCTTQELADELKLFIDAEEAQANNRPAPTEKYHFRPVGLRGRVVRWVERNPWKGGSIGAAVVALLVVVGLSAGWGYTSDRARRTIQEARDNELHSYDSKMQAIKELAEERQRRLDATTSKLEVLQESRRNDYHRTIALADSALQLNDLTRAEEFLAECVPEERCFEWHLLKRRCHPEMLRLRHPDVVLAAAISSDRRWLVTACGDKLVRLFEIPSGKMVRTLEGHESFPTCVAFDSMSKRVYSADRTGELRCWNIADGELVWKNSVSKRDIRSLILHPDGTRLLSAGDDGRIVVTKVSDGAPLKEFVASQGTIIALALHEDAKTLAVGERFPDNPGLGERRRNGSVSIWNLNEMTQGSALGEALPSGVNTLAFDVSGDLWILDREGAIHHRELATGKDKKVFGGRENFLAAFASSPTGQYVAFANVYDHTISLIDEKAKETHELKGHADQLGALRFSEDELWLVSVSADQTARVWEVHAEDRTLVQHPAPVNSNSIIVSVVFSPNNRYLLTTGTGAHLHLWDMKEQQTVSDTARVKGVFATATFHPMGDCVAAGNATGLVYVQDVPDFSKGRYLEAQGHSGMVTGLVWTDAGRGLVTAGKDGKVIFWRLKEIKGERMKASLEKVGVVDVSPRSIWSLAYSPKLDRIAVAGDDGKIHLLDAQSRTILRTFGANESKVTALAFHPDGRLFSAGVDGKLRLWQSETGKLVREAQSHRESVRSLAVSPDGKRVASSGDEPDSTVQLWDVESGHKICTLRGLTSSVICLAFSADGCWLASGTSRGVAKLWDARPMPE